MDRKMVRVRVNTIRNDLEYNDNSIISKKSNQLTYEL